MGLKSDYESLCIQILNTSPFPSLYKAFVIIDGDERIRRPIQASLAISFEPKAIVGWMAFAAFGSGPRFSGGRPICSYCGDTSLIKERYFKLYPKLRGKSSKRKGKGKGPPRNATIADTSLGHVPDLSHIQSQLGLLQSQLWSWLQQQPRVLLPL